MALDGIGATDAERGLGSAAVEKAALTLVVDAGIAVVAALAEGGFSNLAAEDPVAPALMWSEGRSALHELLWRREISLDDALVARAQLEACPISLRTDPRLGEEAWRLADQLGWAKTYDAEYVALAQLLGCRLVTLDARLHRSATALGFVISPTEL